MRAIYALFGLVAAASASRALHYTVPSVLKAAKDCTLPGRFVVSDFTTYKDPAKNTTSSVCFGFLDPDTLIKTTCQRNETSRPSGPSKNVYKCDNSYVSFVYQTSGIAGLTLIEKVCPDNGPSGFEAAGLVQPHLDCSRSSTNTVCLANQTSINGVFDSLEPTPPALSARNFLRSRIV